MEVKHYKNIERSEMEGSVAHFLKELEETIDEGWKVSVEKKNLTVARKRTPGTDVYRLRMIGNLQYPVDVVDAVLNNTELRLKWDKGLTSVEAVEQLENGLSVVYISTNAPPGISNRDFLHLRIINSTGESGSKIILDKSVTHPSKPVAKGYIRAITIFSGLILSKRQTMEGGKILDVTQYAAISQVDVCGELPKLLINAIAAKGTADWFANLDKACAAYISGKLGVKA